MTPSPSDPGKPWIVLVVDDDEGVHEVTGLAVRRARFFGRPLMLKSFYSKAEALAAMDEWDPELLAVALVDVVMEHDTAGLELVEHLRQKFGAALQIIMRSGQPGVMAPEEVSSRFDISNYIAKSEATPERLRTAIRLGIRNFRAHAAMRVLCDSLATFSGLFETATTWSALDQIVQRALDQYSVVWHFDFLFVPDTHDVATHSGAFADEWQEAAYKQILSLDLSSHRSVSFSQLTKTVDNECWGCSVKPLGGRFSAAFAMLRDEPPPPLLLRELHTLLRTWALVRESLLLKQLAANDQTVRAEMHRERSEAIAQMVAGVAHEVNTPLGVANAAAATLSELVAKPHFQALAKQEVFTEDMEDIASAVSLIQRNIVRADALIRSFRQLSVRQLVDRREELELVACIHDAVKLFSPKAKRTGLTINVTAEMDPKVTRWLGYPGHLSQVILNLLTNAERYAYGGQAGKIDVIASSAMNGDVPEFRITVRDYGKGIPAENLSQIWEAFFTTGRSSGGTGLGLSIVRNIVETVFGGSITCDSTLGEGTAFKMRFSHCKSQEAAAESKEQQSSDKLVDRAKVFEEFVELQRRFVAEGSALPVDAQLRITELRGQVESFLAVQFHGKQTRKHPRVPCDRSVTTQAPESAVGGPVRMLDLSEGGALLASKREIAVGTRMTVVLCESPPLTVDATVMSCAGIDGATDTPWRLGVRFEDLGGDERVVRLLIAQSMLDFWR